MTLSGRNALFKTGIALTAFCVVLVIIASFYVIPAYPSMETENPLRPEGFLQAFTGRFFNTDFYAFHVALAAAVLYSFVSIIFIFFYYEKTWAPEILFVAFFSVSFCFEAARLVIPLCIISEMSSFYQLIASRTMLFGRYFGFFSIFTASVCSTGLDVKKPMILFMIILVATLVIAMGIPIDTQTWDTSLNMINGYTAMFRLIETILFLITVISFFIAASIRSSREYIIIGIGTFLALSGRILLLDIDNWAGPVSGILFLTAGTWLICTRLHKIYLWL